jgi:hypothetical protein
MSMDAIESQSATGLSLKKLLIFARAFFCLLLLDGSPLDGLARSMDHRLRIV